MAYAYLKNNVKIFAKIKRQVISGNNMKSLLFIRLVQT